MSSPVDAAKQPGITIGQIVLEEAKFAHREDYAQLPPTTSLGEVPLKLNFGFALTRDRSRGLLRLNVQTPTKGKPLYRLDVTMAAFVEVKPGEANMPLERYAMVSGMAMLYPFLREVVANLTQRGRFGPIWLGPFNVAAAVAEATRSGTLAQSTRGAPRKSRRVR